MRSKMDFPVEIWMRVFELLEPDDYMVVRRRERMLKKYNEVFDEHDRLTAAEVMGNDREAAQVEMNAAGQLPIFERRAWIRTRIFYEINRNSRAAALKSRLSWRLLNNSWNPLPLKLRSDSLPDSSVLTNNWTRDSSRLRSYAVIELGFFLVFLEERERYNPEPVSYFQYLIDPGSHGEKFCCVHTTSKQTHPLRDILMESEHVVILSPCRDKDEEDYHPHWYQLYVVGLMKGAVRQFWAEKGIRYRTVELWE